MVPYCSDYRVSRSGGRPYAANFWRFKFLTRTIRRVCRPTIRAFGNNDVLGPCHPTDRARIIWIGGVRLFSGQWFCFFRVERKTIHSRAPRPAITFEPDPLTLCVRDPPHHP